VPAYMSVDAPADRIYATASLRSQSVGFEKFELRDIFAGADKVVVNVLERVPRPFSTDTSKSRPI